MLNQIAAGHNYRHHVSGAGCPVGYGCTTPSPQPVPKQHTTIFHASHFAGKAANIGFFCPDINKSTFFRTIIMDGAYPRKTFSMGEADEKRFYVEARAITVPCKL